MEFKYFMDGEEKRMGIKINRIIMEFKSVGKSSRWICSV